MTVLGTSLLVLGSEGLLAERAITHQIKGAQAEDAEVDVIRLVGGALDPGLLAESTGASLFAASRIVVISELDQVDPVLNDQLAALALTPSPDLALVLAHPGGVKGKALLDRLKKGKVPQVDAVAPKPWEVPRFVDAEAGRHRIALGPGVAQALVDAVGTDLRTLAGALHQLASDTETPPITVAAVTRYFGGRAEVTSFAVADDIMSGRPGQALEKLRWALGTGVPPVLITSAIAGQLRSLGKYFDLRSARLNDSEVAREVGVPPWKVKDLNRLARNWSERGVAQGVRATARADANVKGAATDPEFALERLLLELDSARQLQRR
jgi:DNA polymerase III subunit delta